MDGLSYIASLNDLSYYYLATKLLLMYIIASRGRLILITRWMSLSVMITPQQSFHCDS
jgi:hypothetical protein